MSLCFAWNEFLAYEPLKASLSIQHNTSRLGSVPTCVCDMAPCGNVYTLQSTGRSGYFGVPLSSALM